MWLKKVAKSSCFSASIAAASHALSVVAHTELRVQWPVWWWQINLSEVTNNRLNTVPWCMSEVGWMGWSSSGLLYYTIFNASSSWPSGSRAGWSAILRQFWGSSCFHEHFILSQPHDENLACLDFFSNYCGCPCVGFTSLRWMIKTKPWLLTLLHWNVIKMYSAYISRVVDGPPSVSAIPGLTSSPNKIKAQENEGTLITWIRKFERTRYISKWDGGTASMCFAWCSTATVRVICIWTFDHLICGVLIRKKNKVFSDIPVQCGLIPATAVPWTALDGYCSSRPPSV